jgi:fructosamine-3-kinase
MNEFSQRLLSVLGTRPLSMQALHGGCVGQVFLARMADRSTVVVKVGAKTGSLDTEGFMLRYLAEHGLPVPRVIHAEPGLLIMEHVEGTSRFSATAEAHAATLLADLHAHTWSAFGLERDTLIGGLHQPNAPSATWTEFFRERRLLHMAREARAEQRLDSMTLSRVERLASRLPEFLNEPDRPCLIHGDVWTTNVLARGDHIAAFLDPAVYYADPEIELAFITLFDTFGEPFFRAYQEHRPLRAGFFETRRHIYNLYSLLVHVRLFGGTYETPLSSTLERLGF